MLYLTDQNIKPLKLYKLIRCLPSLPLKAFERHHLGRRPDERAHRSNDYYRFHYKLTQQRVDTRLYYHLYLF